MGIYYDGNINMNQFNDIQSGAAPFSLRYDAVNDTSQALPQRLVSNEYPGGLLGLRRSRTRIRPRASASPSPITRCRPCISGRVSVQQRLGGILGG